MANKEDQSFLPHCLFVHHLDVTFKPHCRICGGGSSPAGCHILKPPRKNTEILSLCHNCLPTCPQHYLYQRSTTAAIGTVTVGHLMPQLPCPSSANNTVQYRHNIHTHTYAHAHVRALTILLTSAYHKRRQS